MLKVLLASTSPLKSGAVTQFFDETFPHTQTVLTKVDCTACGLPAQPVTDWCTGSNTYRFAKERLNYLTLQQHRFDNYDYTLAIESGIDLQKREDICYVLIYHKGILAHSQSFGVSVPETEDFDALGVLIKSGELIRYSEKAHGYNVTVGEILHGRDPSVDPKNWIGSRKSGGDRKYQILDGLRTTWKALKARTLIKNTLRDAYVEYPNFPKANVLFQDVFPVLRDPYLLRQTIHFIRDHYAFDYIDYVVGLDARGFCLASAVAYEIKAGFVPIRKAGKLPGNKWCVEYVKEYGSDSCEIQCDAFPAGARVLIIDDLIAGGGSMKAALELVELCKGVVVDCCVLRNVPNLRTQCDEIMPRSYTVLLQ